jgi:hypothetical protein
MEAEAVIKISSGWLVVQTMGSGRPSSVNPWVARLYATSWQLG